MVIVYLINGFVGVINLTMALTFGAVGLDGMIFSLGAMLMIVSSAYGLASVAIVRRRLRAKGWNIGFFQCSFNRRDEKRIPSKEAVMVTPMYKENEPDIVNIRLILMTYAS